MYSDRVETGTRRSVKERLDGNFLTDSTRQHKVTGKRQRQDDKWKHDLYDDDEHQLYNRKVTAQDLRFKLQKKGLHPGGQTGKSSFPVERDLRERLSGTMTPQPKNYDPPKPKASAKPSSKSIDVETPSVHIKRSANPTPKKVSRKVYC
ncbi:hypothetical protein DEO72_LG10g2734 [Vigna unguiculata]|uniref:Uncharacterized protein n=1 Tax=Vigna unguiculata TaxID=3917 RepID=A0A4D6NF26_VIGUN|nr:hypothetical protein DEO72_LG10g2734 [Vigna unguiculata]